LNVELSTSCLEMNAVGKLLRMLNEDPSTGLYFVSEVSIDLKAHDLVTRMPSCAEPDASDPQLDFNSAINFLDSAFNPN
jgi:hypothetical protein